MKQIGFQRLFVFNTDGPNVTTTFTTTPTQTTSWNSSRNTTTSWNTSRVTSQSTSTTYNTLKTVVATSYTVSRSTTTTFTTSSTWATSRTTSYTTSWQVSTSRATSKTTSRTTSRATTYSRSTTTSWTVATTYSRSTTTYSYRGTSRSTTTSYTYSGNTTYSRSTTTVYSFSTTYTTSFTTTFNTGGPYSTYYNTSRATYVSQQTSRFTSRSTTGSGGFNPGEFQCVAGNQLIALADGTSILVDDLQPGMQVLSKNGSFNTQDHIALHEFEADDISYLDTRPATVIHCTPAVRDNIMNVNHNLFRATADHMCIAKKKELNMWRVLPLYILREGDSFLDQNNQEVLITSITEEDGQFTVYDIDTEDNDTFYCNGILTHNHLQNSN